MLKHIFDLIFENNETGVRKILTFTVANPCNLPPAEFISYAWDEAIDYAMIYPGHTFLGIFLLE